jgi:hypothetical protein
MGPPVRVSVATLTVGAFVVVVPACPPNRRRIVRQCIATRAFTGPRTVTTAIRTAAGPHTVDATVPPLIGTSENRCGLYEGGAYVLNPTETLEAQTTGSASGYSATYADEIAEENERPRSGSVTYTSQTGAFIVPNTQVPIGFTRVLTNLTIYSWSNTGGTQKTVSMRPAAGPPDEIIWSGAVPAGSNVATGGGLQHGGAWVMPEGYQLITFNRHNLHAAWYDQRNEEVL